jgi:uncharacterized protein YajQ (UPF0234 family)
MPSFDIVSEVDLHLFTNAVDQAARVVETRFDFKGIDASYERDKLACTITAQADFQIDQMVDILRGTLIKSKIDPLAMEVGDLQPTGKLVKKVVTLKNGLEIEIAKKITKMIKEGKTKVTTQIQDEQVRVTGKKRDDLQEVMAMLRAATLDQPLQFTNFRD